MSDTPAYTRLPGRSPQLFGLVLLLEAPFFWLPALLERMRLYEAPDHLLVVRRRFFHETAQRFYFRDVQALTLRRTANHITLNLLLAPILLAAVLPLLLNWGSAYQLPAIAAAGMIALGIGVNILRGPTCALELHTAVHRQALPCVGRWRTGQRIVRHLQPTIARAQVGQSAPQEMEVEAETLPLTTGQYTSPPRESSPLPRQTRVRPRLEMVFFALVLILGLSAFSDLFHFSSIKNMFDGLLIACALILGCVVFARTRHTDQPAAARVAAGMVLFLSVLLFYTGGVAGFLLGIELGPDLDPLTLDEMLYAHPLFRTLIYVQFVTFSVLGAWGLLSLRN